jgi:quercetin dioxygenase-like cupin family protein
MPAEQKVSVYLRTHRLRGKVLRLLLGAEDDMLREQAASSTSGRAAKTLIKQGPFRVTLVAMRKGVALQEHQVAGPLSIQAIRGCVRVTTDQGDVDVPQGGLIGLESGVVHSARAADDCAILITLVMP